MAARPPLWTRLFTCLTVANLCVSMIFYLLTSTMSGWAADQLGGSSTLVGLVGSSWFVGAVLARLLAAPMLGRWGQRALMLGSLTVMLLGSLGYLAVTSVGPLLLGLRFVHGLGFGLAATTLAGIALGRVPVERRGEGSGWFTFGMAVSTGIAPFIGNLVQRGAGERTVFWVAVAFGLVGVAMALLVVHRVPSRPTTRPERVRGFRGFLEPSVLPIAAAVALCAVPFGAVLTHLNAFATQIGLAHAGGLYFLVYAAVICFSRPVAGILQDRRGDTSILLPMVGALVLGLVLTATATTGLQLLAGGLLLGLGFGTLTPAGQTVAINLAGARRSSIAVASYYFLADGGTGTGPFVLGALTGPLGERGAMLAVSTSSLLGLALMVPVVVRRRRSLA